MNDEKFSPIIFWPAIVLASFFEACLIKWFNHNPINIDGILYLDVAKLYAAQGLTAALKAYPWPFYPIVIAYLSQFFHAGLLNTAFWVNNLLITAALVFWLAMFKEMTGREESAKIRLTVIFWASVLILAYPSLNHLRGFIIRDAGYWAFLFAGLWCIFQSLKITGFFYSIFYGLIYSLCFFIASLFRIEGAVVWVFAPCIFLCLKNKDYLKFFVHESLFFLMIILLICWKLSNHTHHFSQLGRINNFWEIFQQTAQIFIRRYSFDFIAAFFEDLLKTITPLYGVLILYGLYRRRKSTAKKAVSPQMKLWLLLLLIQLIIPLVFYGQTGITTERYLMPFSMTALLLAPFAFRDLSKKLWVIIIPVLSVSAYGGIVPFGHSKAYLAESGNWLKQHSQASDNLYSNSREVLFYAGRETLNREFNDSPDKILALLTQRGKIFYNYLAIRLNKNDNVFFQEKVNGLARRPIKIFHNKHDDKVMIFYGAH